MLWQASKTLWLDYPDTYIKIGFTGRLHLWWPLLLCRAIANGFHPTTHKVNLQASKAIILPKTKVSRHSHHLGQIALPETHWPFRVSGCDPYLNPYLNIYTTRHHEVSPRDSWNYAYHTKFIFHTIFTTFGLKHPILMQILNQPTKQNPCVIHANIQIFSS